MPWVGNEYIFPRAAPAYASWPAPPAPPAPPPPPAIPQRWRRPEQIDGGNGDFEDPPDSSFGGTPPGPTAPGPPSGVVGIAPAASLAGTALSGLLGVPGLGLGLGLLGSLSDVARAEEALAEEYGTEPPGYPRGYSPEFSTWDTFLNAISPFGIFGQSVEDALAQEVAHMGVVGLEGIGYGGFGVPGVEEQEAAEAWGGYETAPPDAPFADFGFGFGFGGTEEDAADADADEGGIGME